MADMGMRTTLLDWELDQPCGKCGHGRGTHLLDGADRCMWKDCNCRSFKPKEVYK